MFYVVSKVDGEYVNTTVCQTEEEANDIVASRKAAQPYGSHSVSEEYPADANPIYGSGTVPGHYR